MLGEALVSSCTSRCLPFSTIQQSQWEYFIYFVREELDRSPHQAVCQVLLPFSSLTDWSLPLCTYSTKLQLTNCHWIPFGYFVPPS